MQPAVVDAVEPALAAVVLAAHAGQEVAVVVTQGHVETVHPVVDALDDQLGEDRGGLAVHRGITEVVLPRRLERGVNLELVRLREVGGGGADGGHVRAVTDLGHREDPGDLQVQDAREPREVVLLGAQVEHRGAEQTPLHAGLDLQGRVREDEFLERGEVRARVQGAAHVVGHAHLGGPGVPQQLQLLERGLTLLLERLVVLGVEAGILGPLARRLACFGPAAQQDGAELGGVDPGRGGGTVLGQVFDAVGVRNCSADRGDGHHDS